MTAVAGSLLCVLVAVEAQSGAKIPKIGILQVGTSASGGHLAAAFKQEMRDRGYVEGQGILFEQRFGEGKRERLSDAARELVRLKVDIIVTSTDEGIAAVKQQTQTIPIVMANSTDPVGTGFVASLARPGGNVTDHSSMSPEPRGESENGEGARARHLPVARATGRSRHRLTGEVTPSISV